MPSLETDAVDGTAGRTTTAPADTARPRSIVAAAAAAPHAGPVVVETRAGQAAAGVSTVKRSPSVSGHV